MAEVLAQFHQPTIEDVFIELQRRDEGAAYDLVRRIGEAPLWPMLWKELVQLRRDRITLAMMLGIPAIQLALFGYAIQTEVRHLPTVVLDESRTSESRRLVEVIRNSGNFDIVGTVHESRRDARRRSRRGRANAAPGDSAGATCGPEARPHGAGAGDRGRRRPARLVRRAVGRRSGAAAPGRPRSAGTRGPAARLDVRVRPWYNPGLRSAVYIVPGIIGVLLSLTLVLITSMAIVRERERGTLEQLIVTPIDKTSLMLGKILPFLLIGYVQITVILVLGRLLFRVPILGSLPLLYLLSFAFIVASLALGLLMSTWCGPRSRRCSSASSSSCPTSCSRASCFRGRPCRCWPSGSARRCRSPTSSPFSAACCSRASGSASSGPRALALAGFAVVLVALSVLRFQKTIE